MSQMASVSHVEDVASMMTSVVGKEEAAAGQVCPTAVCCDVLQCVAACCSVLQCASVSVLQCVAVCFSVLQSECSRCALIVCVV